MHSWSLCLSASILFQLIQHPAGLSMLPHMVGFYPSHGLVVFYHVHVLHFLYSSTMDSYCFHSLATVNSAAVNMRVQIPRKHADFISFGYMARRETSEFPCTVEILFGTNITILWKFLKKLNYFLKKLPYDSAVSIMFFIIVVLIYISANYVQMFSFSISLASLVILYLCNNILTGVIYHCNSDLPVLNMFP